MTDKEHADTQIAMLYVLRLRIKENDKEAFTKDEILELFDTVKCSPIVRQCGIIKIYRN